MRIDLRHGDCLDVLKTLPDNSIDLVLTDPPYRMTKRGKSCRPNWMKDGMGDNVFEGNIPSTDEWLGECFRVMKPMTHIYIFTNTISLHETMNSAAKSGFKMHNLLTMIKDTGMPNRWYYKQTELILFYRKGRAKPINDYTSRDNFRAVMPKRSTGKIHLTQKPQDVCEMLIKNSTVEGEVVLDPFMGSGTTGAAAKETGRSFVGIEKSDEHFLNAKNRINGVQENPNDENTVLNFF